MRKGLAVATSVLVVLAVTVPLATAGGGAKRQSLDFGFTSKQPGSASGDSLVIDYFNPTNPAAKPFAVDEIVLTFHPGTKIDTSVPAQCKATDPQLMAQGADACPDASIVGGGVIKLDTGLPAQRRLTTDATLINNKDELIMLAEERMTKFRFVARAEARGRTVTTPVPAVPGGPPDNQVAIDVVDVDVRKISNARGNYITTPGSCPSSGRWTNRGTFKYDEDEDGTFDNVQTLSSTSACTSGSAGGGDGREIQGTANDDVLTGTDGDDVIRCGAGNDRVNAGGGDDVVFCGSGNDVVRGGSGEDRLYGESGHDDVFGDAGNDLLDGGAGEDRLVGGSGNDRFEGGSGQDSITQ